jgi:hypothetical protein
MFMNLPTINLQCMPTPEIWVPTASDMVPIVDADGNWFVDADGNVFVSKPQ